MALDAPQGSEDWLRILFFSAPLRETVFLQKLNEAPPVKAVCRSHPLWLGNWKGIGVEYWRTSKRMPMIGVTLILMPPP